MKKFAGFWYSFVVVVVLIAALAGMFDQYSYEGGWSQASLLEKVGIPTVFITFVGFWLLMLEDFFDNDEIKHRVLVGFSLFFLHWLAILIYFWTVVYRRKNAS
ncbi:hypothetical protein [Thalassomonas actiniarum]|uniref:Uncharacterized protein n=1 Tax=Thalassomonas actiniarum TaxID=485447 RepID=A0AAE9YZP3_9GAMM|nr:hypothetical protein [Thalassomonas actiniarum]WDE02498.1 hypothetical protein SG35_029250 [Thalassomonas actiniarum]